MNPFDLAAHLEDTEPRGHEVDWADDLDADQARRLHDELHSHRPVFPVGHDHKEG